MKILFWNIGYAPGLDGSLKNYTLRGYRLLRMPIVQQKLVLNEIARVINEEKADIALYAETSLGSGRNAQFNQHEYLISQVTDVVSKAATSKYKHAFVENLPLHKGNANGFLSKYPTKVQEAHFSVGRKTLVYILEVGQVTIVMVHLSLKRKNRKIQLQELAILVNAIRGPVVVCGDMNIFGGIAELDELLELTDLALPDNIPFTYPAFNPKQSLDLFLTRDCGRVIMSSLTSVVSDHSPIVIEMPKIQ